MHNPSPSREYHTFGSKVYFVDRDNDYIFAYDIDATPFSGSASAVIIAE